MALDPHKKRIKEILDKLKQERGQVYSRLKSIDNKIEKYIDELNSSDEVESFDDIDKIIEERAKLKTYRKTVEKEFLATQHEKLKLEEERKSMQEEREKLEKIKSEVNAMKTPKELGEATKALIEKKLKKAK